MIEENNFKKDELDELQDAIQGNGSIPDTQFANSLRSKLVDQFVSNPSNLNFNKTKMSTFPKRVVAVSAAFLSLATIVGIGGVLFVNRPGIRPTNISPRELAARLNNSKINNQNFDAFTATAGAGGPERKMASILPYFEDKEFTYSKTNTEIGPKANDCYAYQPYGLTSYSSESYNYYLDGKHYSKWVEYDNNGKVYMYSLSTPEYTYDFAGGKIVGRAKAQEFRPYLLREGDIEESTMPIEDEMPVEMLTIEEPVEEKPLSISDLFGEDAQILGEEKLDGKMYYVVSSEYQSYCDEKSEDIIINHNWIDSETYATYKTETYLNEVNRDNLISRYEYKFETGKKELDEVAKHFEFDIEAKIVDFDPNYGSTDSVEFINAFKKLLTDKNAGILVPTNYSFSGYYSDMVELENPYSYRISREFFRDDELGNKMYKQEIENSQSSFESNTIYSITYTLNEGEIYKYVSIDTLDKNLTDTDLKQTYGLKLEDGEIVKLKIDGTDKEARLFTQEDINYGDPETQSYTEEVDPFVCDTCSQNFTFLIEEDSRTTIIRVDAMSKEEATKVEFGLLDPSQIEDMQIFEKMMEDYRNNPDNQIIAY